MTRIGKRAKAVCVSIMLTARIFNWSSRQWVRAAGLLLAMLVVAVSFNPPHCHSSDSGTVPAPAGSSPNAPGRGQAEPGSGVRGAMVAAWGNAPANPPTYQCVKVFDASGQKLVATGTCSGTWASFRVPLPPGRYVVDKEGERTTVDVGAGQWVNLSPKPLPGPVP